MFAVKILVIEQQMLTSARSVEKKLPEQVVIAKNAKNVDK